METTYQEDDCDIGNRAKNFYFLSKITLPILLFLVVLEFLQGRAHMMISIFTGVCVLGASIYMVRQRVKTMWWLRLSLGYCFCLGLFYVLQDYTPGSLLYLVIFPILNSLLLGGREGMIWNVFAGLSSGSLLMPGYGFESLVTLQNTAVDFIVVFCLASATGYVIQKLRVLSQARNGEKMAGLSLELTRLEHELACQKLRDQPSPFPIPVVCAACRQFRMEDMSWVSGDVYLQRINGMRVSHGYCTKCASDLFMELE